MSSQHSDQQQPQSADNPEDEEVIRFVPTVKSQSAAISLLYPQIILKEENVLQSQQHPKQSLDLVPGTRSPARTQKRTAKLRSLSHKCDQAGCETQFSRKSALLAHLRQQHRIKKFRCLQKYCIESFDTNSQLAAHQAASHADLDDALAPSWKCQLCDARLFDHFSLVQHHFRIHEQGVFQCAFNGCPFASSDRKSVVAHYEKTHDSFACDSCERAFYRLYDLQRHQLVHLNLKPYACPVANCGAAFRYKYVLTAHQLVHLGVSPYYCTWPDCTTQSGSRSGLTTHIRMVHFRLPATIREQNQRNIVDDRNPRDFLGVHPLLIQEQSKTHRRPNRCNRSGSGQKTLPDDGSSSADNIK